MKRFHEQFNNQAKQVKLTAVEQRELRDRVNAYMEYHPLPKATKKSVSTVASQTSVSQERGWVLPLSAFRARYIGSIVGSVSVFLLVLVPMMAEQAMPGDMLYSVKVGFNEEVRSTITRSPYQIVEWESERINRRLSEIQVLAREGRLTDEHEARAAQAVRSHSQSARESIEEIRAEDEDEAAMAEIALSALFDVHVAVLSAREQNDAEAGAILTEVVTTSEDDDNSDSDTAERRNQLLEAIESSRNDVATARDGERPTYAGLLRRIEVETARAYELLANVADLVEEEALTSITRRLDDVGRKVQTAQVAFDEDELIEARVQLTEALTTTRKIITFLSNIEIRNSIDLDTLVPIEYTSAELGEQLHFKRERLQVRYEYIDSVIADHATGTVLERAEAALVPLPETFAQSSQAIGDEDFATAGTLLSDIEQILDDIVRMAEIPDRLPSDEVVAPASIPATSTPATTTEAMATSSDATATSSPANEDAAEESVDDTQTSTSSDESSGDEIEIEIENEDEDENETAES